MYIPTLDDPGKRLLRVLQRSGVAPGWQIMSEASMNADELAKAAPSLVSMGIISVQGNLSASSIGSAYFNLQPSGSRMAELMVNA